MSHEEEDDSLPVLNAVVESGNESIIQSSRLGREVLRELEVLQEEPNPVKFVLQEHVLDAEEEEQADQSVSEESQLHLMMGDPDAFSEASDNSDDAIELMIDEVVDRHITELRRDIRLLLTRVKQNT